MAIPLFQVDAFTTEPFRGNPAAVCLLDSAADAAWMLAVAGEMNLSETAFVVARDGDDGFGLRWFTPRVEVELCGHATLASAHVLWETGRVARGDEARFHTASGVLGARRNGDGTIWLDFPALESEECAAPDGLAAALGTIPVRVARNRHDLLVELASPDEVRELTPDFARVATIDVRAVVVTALAADEPGDHDFVSRCFAPGVGIDEDPVTGSAHCALGP